MDGSVRVVAVAAAVRANRGLADDRHRAVAVPVAVVVAAFVGAGGAVVVDAVAALRRAGMDGRVAVIAVQHGRGGRQRAHRWRVQPDHRGIAVAVLVVVAALVGHAVAVVVHVVAQFHGAGRDPGRVVVAVQQRRACRFRARRAGAGRPAHRAIAIAVTVAVAAVVGDAVAVVVQAVAGRLGGRLPVGYAAVVAQPSAAAAGRDRLLHCAYADLPARRFRHRQVARLVSHTVAVVVDAVALLGLDVALRRARHGGLVARAHDRAAGARAGEAALADRALRDAVKIGVAEVLVGLAVAVVVQAVAGRFDHQVADRAWAGGACALRIAGLAHILGIAGDFHALDLAVVADPDAEVAHGLDLAGRCRANADFLARRVGQRGQVLVDLLVAVVIQIIADFRLVLRR